MSAERERFQKRGMSAPRQRTGTRKSSRNTLLINAVSEEPGGPRCGCYRQPKRGLRRQAITTPIVAKRMNRFGGINEE